MRTTTASGWSAATSSSARSFACPYGDTGRGSSSSVYGEPFSPSKTRSVETCTSRAPARWAASATLRVARTTSPSSASSACRYAVCTTSSGPCFMNERWTPSVVSQVEPHGAAMRRLGVQAERDHVVARRDRLPADLGAEIAGAAGDEDLHRGGSARTRARCRAHRVVDALRIRRSHARRQRSSPPGGRARPSGRTTPDRPRRRARRRRRPGSRACSARTARRMDSSVSGPR